MIGFFILGPMKASFFALFLYCFFLHCFEALHGFFSWLYDYTTSLFIFLLLHLIKQRFQNRFDNINFFSIVWLSTYTFIINLWKKDILLFSTTMSFVCVENIGFNLAVCCYSFFLFFFCISLKKNSNYVIRLHNQSSSISVWNGFEQVNNKYPNLWSNPRIYWF